MTSQSGVSEPRQEAVTRSEVEDRISSIGLDAATKIRTQLRAALRYPEPRQAFPVPDPVYRSWNHYLTTTTESERRAWCRRKAARANRTRLMSGPVEHRLNVDGVMSVLLTAQGRCAHCHSLAVENRPSKRNGAPAPWENTGRRIGSLGHLIARVHGGTNDLGNLAWSCLWCNTWPSERQPGANDHGGIQ